MQALRLFAPHDLRLVEVDDPKVMADEVKVRVDGCGVCGTDRHLYHGEFPSRGPVTLGHEFCGIVIEAGANAAIPVGTRVTCDPNDACMTCPACLKGRTNLCERNVASGISRDGGFAPIAVLPARRAIALPTDLPPLYGAFAEPLACTIHGLDMAALRPGERCLILGGGVIGLLALQLARLAGAETMLLTRSREKQDLALSLGANHVATTSEAARAIWPGGAEAVLECAGVVDTVEMAPSLCATGGRVVILGVLPQGQRVQIEPFDLLFREIQLLHSFINPFTQTRAAALIASGAVSVAPLISRVVPLSEAHGVIAKPAAKGEIRVIVVPE